MGTIIKIQLAGNAKPLWKIESYLPVKMEEMERAILDQVFDLAVSY